MPIETLLISLALLNSAFAKPKTLDFESKACNTGQLLEKLSAVSGMKLKAATSLAQEIVFVHAHDVKPEELKSKIAEALEASWVKKTDADYLDRTPAQEKAIWNKHIALRRKFVDEELGKKQKELSESFDASALATGLIALKSQEEIGTNPAAGRARYERQQYLFSQAPLARLLHRLVLACDPNDLAAIGPYERRIFKLSPTLMQKRIERKKYEAAIAAFAREQQAWIEVAEKTVFPERNEGMMVSDPRAHVRYSPNLDGVALEISRGDMTALFNVNLIGERAQGFGRGVLTQSMYADPARRFLNLQGVPTAPPDNDPPVELSELSKEFQAVLVGTLGQGTRSKPSERMTQVLLNPDKIEPLGLASSDALKSYAKVREQNIVAALPDQVFTLTYYLSRQQGTRTNQFIHGLVSSGTIALRESDGWAIFAPSDRYEAALEFTPRAPISELMAAVASKGRLELRDFAKYAFKSGRITRMGVGDLYLALWDRSVLSSFDRTEWNGLRLYGSFSAQQQNALEEGARFPLLGLNAAQKEDRGENRVCG